MAFFQICGTSPLSKYNDDSEQSPLQGGIIVEGDLEQLNENSVWSKSLSVRYRTILAACSQATCKRLRRCSGRASVT